MFNVFNFFLYIKNWFWIFLEFKKCINSIKCWMFYREKIRTHSLHSTSIYTTSWTTPLPHKKQEGRQERGTYTWTTSTSNSKYHPLSLWLFFKVQCPSRRELTLGVVKYFNNYFQKDPILSWKYADIVCFFLITIRISLQLVNHYKLQNTNWGYR